ncbi:MAG: deoxyribonuclease V [Anaerolineae bacterium]|nr:deoxyribonuclease V [Anaerolineae bacterium]
MNVSPLHDWNLTPTEAIALQKQMAAQVRPDDPFDRTAVRLVAGVDVSVKRDEHGQRQSRAAVVVLTFPEMAIIETVRWQIPTPYPYIPGLLTFREGPVLAEAFRQLRHEPDVFVFDGMGIIHPRRIGIAAHMGLWLERPTIGVGKTHLLGDYETPPDERGAWSPLIDHDQLLGAVLRTRERVKPIYVSAGHRMNLPAALEIVMACTRHYRLPEPIRAAHKAAGEMD